MKLTERRLKKLVKEEVDKLLNEEGFDNFPPGWDGDSVEDFAESFVGQTEEEGFFTACMEEAEGEDWIEGEPEKFCGSLKDQLHGTDWREGPESD